MHERIIVNLVCSENSICSRTLNLNRENIHTVIYLCVYICIYVYISETNDTHSISFFLQVYAFDIIFAKYSFISCYFFFVKQYYVKKRMDINNFTPQNTPKTTQIEKKKKK